MVGLHKGMGIGGSGRGGQYCICLSRWMSRPGRGAGIAPGPFPRTSRRTRLARRNGLSTVLPSGWYSS